MCRISAALSTAVTVPSWKCTNGVPTTDYCTTWTGVTCVDGKPTEIYLSSKALPGTISSSFGQLTSLTSLYLSFNSLNNIIPSQIGSLSKIVTINLGFNKLVGSIPSSLGQMSSLTYL